MAVGAHRRSGARPCERCLRVGATDAFGNARDALVAPRMHRSDAEDDVRNSRKFRRLGDLEIYLYSSQCTKSESVYRFAKTKRCQSKRFGKTKRLLDRIPAF